MTSSVLDSVLDLSVLGGYTYLGYGICSRGWRPLPRMDGKVAFITSAMMSSLELAVADGFASLGATVWLAVRNRQRGEAARARYASIRAKRTSCSSFGQVLDGPAHRAADGAA